MLSSRCVRLLLFVFSAWLTACDPIGVLQSENGNDQSELSSDEILRVRVTGGIAGVEQLLHVEEDGRAEFSDRTFTRTQATRQLQQSEVDDLTTLMSSNRFFELGDSYIDPNTADAFLYEITFRSGDESKTVTTDEIAAPSNLKGIVAGLNALIEKIKNNGLELTLALDRNQSGREDSTAMTLTVRNVLSRQLTLRFRDGQIFDFSAAQTVPQSNEEKIVWNWAHDRAFTQALWDMVLEPGQTEAYQVVWNGKSNDGQVLSGEFRIRAELVSLPGGATRPETLTISE